MSEIMDSVKLTFLGTGTSTGVPMIGCDCEVCRSEDSRDKRLRTAALVETNGLTIAVDAGMDFRQQMLRQGVRNLDAIIMTHNHKDHTGGLDDVRSFNYFSGMPTQIYCEEYVRASLQREFPYAFEENKYPGAPEWNIHLIDENPFSIVSPLAPQSHPIMESNDPKDNNNIDGENDGDGLQRFGDEKTDGEINDCQSVRKIDIIPIRGIHYKLPVLGFRFGNIAYCTDMNFIPETEFAKLQGLEHFVISCVRRGPHISHYSLEEAVAVAEHVGAKHTWLTHLSHQLPRHIDLCAELPPHIRPAYDTLTITGSY